MPDCATPVWNNCIPRQSIDPLTFRSSGTEISLALNHEAEVKPLLEVQSESVQIDPDADSRQESPVQHEISNVPVPFNIRSVSMTILTY